MELQETARGIIVDVYVKPRSRQFQLKLEEDEIIVSCQEVPVKGRVNRELVKELSKLFKRRVEILSGFGSRRKKVLIEYASAEEVRKVLGENNY